MWRVALTGGIASGKSTVAAMFEEFGITIIDADIVAHQLVAQNSSILSQIVTHFGCYVLNEAGQIDRAKLRTIIFDNYHERIWLEQLLHPPILATMLKQAEKATSPYCMLVIPLLVEAQLVSKAIADRILVLDCDIATQKQRIALRVGMTPALIEKILSAQVSREARLAVADDIMTNNGNLAELRAQVAELHHLYLNLARK